MLQSRPDWWRWEVEITSHAERRMEDREFTEIELRGMLDAASSIREDYFEGRWVVETRHRGRSWEVVVEPDSDATLLVIITAYPVGV